MAPRPAPETAPAAIPVFRKSRRVTPMAFWKLAWPAAFSSGLKYIALTFRAAGPSEEFGYKIVEPCPAPDLGRSQCDERHELNRFLEGGRGVANPKWLHHDN